MDVGVHVTGAGGRVTVTGRCWARCASYQAPGQVLTHEILTSTTAPRGKEVDKQGTEAQRTRPRSQDSEGQYLDRNPASRPLSDSVRLTCGLYIVQIVEDLEEGV